MRRRIPQLVAIAVACGALLAATPPAGAESYQGWGDTGWSFDNKRDCCDEAVWLAQDDSARLCEMSGGHPRIRSGSSHGLCDWDSRGSGRERVYRCTARTEVYCR